MGEGQEIETHEGREQAETIRVLEAALR